MRPLGKEKTEVQEAAPPGGSARAEPSQLARLSGLLVLALLGVANPAWAHDAWITPIPPGRQAEPDGQRMLIGHPGLSDPYAVKLTRFQQMLLHQREGQPLDLLPLQPRPTDPATGALVESDRLRLPQPLPSDAWAVTLITTPAQNRLPADRFNAHLQEEGLTPAIEARERLGQTGAEGRESYSRRIKLLLGDPTAWTQATGLDLELVPESDPRTLAAGARWPVQVLWRGAPLPGATVKIWNLEFGTTPFGREVSDGTGRVTLPMLPRGSWLVTVVWLTPEASPPVPDAPIGFDTVFHAMSLTL